MERFLDYDPLSGAVETFSYDEGEDRAVIRRRADVQPVIDRNKELSNHTDGTHSTLGWHAASIPIEVVYKWLVQFGIDATRKEHWPQVKRLLNSNEYRHLRVKHFII